MYIEIDGNTRKIKITQEQRLFGVVQDCNAERKYFKMPRIVGNNIDVTNCIIYIVYQKSDEVGNIYYGEPNMYICEDVVLDETEQNVTFSWELTKDIFDISGYLGFKILVECTDNDGNVKNVWNTIPEFGIICKSMFGDKIQHIQEQNKDIVGRLLQDLKQIKNDMKMKITQPDVAKEGQTFRIKQINEDGTLVVEAVDMTSGGVTDVQIDGSSVVSDGVASLPFANMYGKVGIVRLAENLGVKWSDAGGGGLSIDYANPSNISSRGSSNKPIIPYYLDYAVKAAMCDGKGAAWTEDEQAAARARMGIYSNFELINSVVIEEEASTIIFDTTDNGDAYDFSDAEIILNLPAISVIDLTVSFNKQEQYYPIIYRTVGNSSYETFYRFRTLNNGNKFLAISSYHTNSINNPSTNTVVSSINQRDFDGHIKIIRFFTDAQIPIGTKIEIYGKR